MAVKRNYRINLRNYGNPPAVMVSQYDENYSLTFEVYDGPLPASGLNTYTVKLVGTRADTLKYSFDGTVTGVANNVLNFTIDTTMTACAGKGVAEIVILDATNDVKFASFNLPVYVEKAAVPDDAIDADVERAQEIADQVEELIDGATEGAEAWAVGQRGGVDVESTDPTYHNNAKYYAEQAQDIADSIGIDATLSVAEKAADAKKTGDEISSLKEDLNSLDGRVEALEEGSGLSETVAQLLIGILQKGMYTTDVSDDIDVLYELLTNDEEIVIPATSVTLSENVVTILDATKTVQLIATPVPSITTDTPVWTSSDNTVATVDANGVITGVANGNCVIRCTYGNVFAECSVYCTLGADLIYVLPTPFTGDGQTTIDTGWEMAGSTDPDSGYNTNFTMCYDVECTAIVSSVDPFVSLISDGNKNYIYDFIDVINGNVKITSQTLAAQRGVTTLTKSVPIRAKCVRTHTAQAREMSQYFYYVTGDELTKVENFVESSAATLYTDVNRTVILGGKYATDGTIASYMTSAVTIKDFKIYNRVLSASEISEYLGKDVTA